MIKYSVLIIGGIVFQVELHLRAIGLLGAGHGSSAAADLVVEPYGFGGIPFLIMLPIAFSGRHLLKRYCGLVYVLWLAIKISAFLLENGFYIFEAILDKDFETKALVLLFGVYCLANGIVAIVCLLSRDITQRLERNWRAFLGRLVTR